MYDDEILRWLLTRDEARLAWLWTAADRARREHVGAAVHLRGLIEFSNRCDRACLYCGMHRANRDLARYTMSRDEIVAGAREAARRGYGSVVLQSGEALAPAAPWLADVVRAIKATTDLAVTLSVGERPVADHALWREAGADRYLLRFETSDPALLQRLHPPRGDASGAGHPRLAGVRALQELGYETGSGFMVGLPGQTYASVARDIATVRDLELDMVGVGCYVPHPATSLGREHAALVAAGRYTETPRPDGQIPNTALATLAAVALVRLAAPQVHLPASTALATVSEDGYAAGLRRGCNVIMPNLTPDAYRLRYDIYPTPLRGEESDAGAGILRTIEACGRTVGAGPGGSARGRRGGDTR